MPLPRSFTSLRREGVRGRRAGGLTVALLVVGFLLAGPAGALGLLQAAVDGPSPAQGHAEVIAHGVSAMPADQIAWRVVADTAEPLDTAEPAERALGFVLADEGAVVVNDLTYGTQTRVAAGEASFIPEGAVEQRASLNEDDVSYYRLALVPAEDASDGGGDDLLFAGDGFAAPDGRRDIDLVRDVLATDEETAIDDSGYPVLILVTAGEIEIESDGGSTATLGAGEAATYDGDLAITGTSDEDAAFVAAVIGPDVPAPPRFAGTIYLAVYACPPDITAENLIEAPDDVPFQSCEPVDDPAGEGLELALQTPDDELPLADATTGAEGSDVLWSPLAFGDYEVGDPTALPSGYGDAILTDRVTNVLESGEVTIDSQAPDAFFRLYLVSSAAGSVSVTVHNCPPGMTADTLAGDFCDPATEGFDVTLELFEGDGQGASLSLGDAAFNDPSWTWSGIELPGSGDPRPLGVHESLPDGYTSYVVVGNGEILEFNDVDPAYYGFEVSTDAPTMQLDVYNFTEAGGAGSIAITGYVCPAAESSAEECVANGSIALDGVVITTDQGGDALTAGNGEFADNTYSWPIVPLGSFFIQADGLAPAGYSIVGVDGASLADSGWAFDLTADQPSANLAVYVVSDEPVDEPVDTDADGLSDEDEATNTTDPNDPDSDDDCHSDGAEVAAATNPNDATSLPDGDCDI